MADETLFEKVHELSDLELATLICLVAQEHCIIDTEPVALDELAEELELVASNVFGLTSAVIECSEHTTLDDFAHAICTVSPSHSQTTSPIGGVKTRQETSYFLHSPSLPAFGSLNRSPVSDASAEHKTIANIIIAKNLDEAPRQVQIQALELMRTKRIYTRTSVQNAPKRFLFLALVAGGQGPRLTKHLNDYMFISHFHDPEDGFPNLQEMYDDGNSTSSVVKRSPSHGPGMLGPRITEGDVEELTRLGGETTVSVEVKSYMMHVVTFLRAHRAVKGGITAMATKHFDKLTRCFPPLHNLTYAPPSLIALAARKIYPHRIHIVKPGNERSMQWGSDLNAVSALLDGIGVEDIIEDVLSSSGAEVPL